MVLPVDVTHLFAAIDRAKKSANTSDLLQICGLLGALLTVCREAAKDHVLERHGLQTRHVCDTEDLTVAEFAARSKMSKTWIYRHAHEMSWAHRNGRSWRFSWAGYEKSKNHAGK